MIEESWLEPHMQLRKFVPLTVFGEGLAKSDLQGEERNRSLVVVGLQFIIGRYGNVGYKPEMQEG